MKITITLLFLVLLSSYTALGLSVDETASAENVSEAFSKAKIKGQLRYSTQHRDSNLQLTQDSSTPGISDESTSFEGLKPNFAYLNRQKERNVVSSGL